MDGDGDLLLTLGESVVRQPKPFVYQEVAGARRAVEGGYALDADGRVGFALGDYDARLPLVIDPVLIYSTYLGGSGNDSGPRHRGGLLRQRLHLRRDHLDQLPHGQRLRLHVQHRQRSADADAFVTKLNAAGTALVYSTYLGGTGNTVNLSGDDVCSGIAMDSAGNAYLAGETRSTNFPTANALQATFGGGLFEALPDEAQRRRATRSSTRPTSAATPSTRPAASRWIPPATPTSPGAPPRRTSPRSTPSRPRSPAAAATPSS